MAEKAMEPNSVSALPRANAEPGRTLPWGRSRTAGFMKRALWVALGLMCLAAAWELLKYLVPAEGIEVAGVLVLPRTSDIAMPHVTEMFARLLEPVTGSADAQPLWEVVAAAAWFTLRLAAVGWSIGLVIGFGLAVAMQRFGLAKDAALPWVVLSQTVPLIAIAPLVRRWGTAVQFGAFSWENWMSVSVIAAYLAFFPVSIATLRGLESITSEQRDLMRAYGQGWWGEFRTLRIPASIPFVLTGLRLAAANAVVGAVVAEVSIGLRGGIGRLIVEFAAASGGDPAKPWTAIFGAVAVGLVAVGLVSLIGVFLRKYRRAELS